MGLRRACSGDAVISFSVMMAVEVVVAGGSIISKAALSRGMNRYVFVVYYNALGTLLLLPCFIFHRRRPPLTLSLMCKFFLLGMIGSYGMIFAYTGIDYSSPTLYSAVSNLMPAFIFILAALFRLEKIDIRNRSSQAKALGTIVSISGAIIVTLYKGQPLIVTQQNSSFHQLLVFSQKVNWVLGSLFVTANSLLISIWTIFQTTIVKEYPAVPVITFFYCFFATLHSAIFTLIAERESIWRLRHGIEYLSVVYSAIVGAILSVVIHTWYLRVKGPIFVSIFKPFGIVVAFIMSIIVLGEKLYIGSVIGSVVISIGFYGVLWGKFDEEKLIEDINTSSLESSSHVPLLAEAGDKDNSLVAKG